MADPIDGGSAHRRSRAPENRRRTFSWSSASLTGAP